MFDLSDQMRAATAEPPPTGIDLDRLIGGERRRSRLVRVAGVGLVGAVAVAVGVGVVPALRGGHPVPRFGGPGGGPGTGAGAATYGTVGCGPNTLVITGPNPAQQSPTARKWPTEPVDSAVPRLSAVLRAELARLVPDAVLADALHVGCPEVRFHFHPRYLEYEAAVKIADGDGYSTLHVTIAPGDVETYNCDTVGQTCQKFTLPDGSRAMAQQPTENQTNAAVARDDGTVVFLALNNAVTKGPLPGERTRPQPILTTDQLYSLGMAAGLTLYP